MKPSIPPVQEEDLSPETREVLSSLPDANLLQVFANAPASLKPFVEFGGSILFGSEFDPRSREIAVLRVAHISRCEYVWVSHVALGKAVGVTQEQIDVISTEDPVVSLDDEANLLCRVADEISRDVRLSDEALSEIIEAYGNRGATELILCMSHFNLMTRFLESTRTELDSSETRRSRGSVDEFKSSILDDPKPEDEPRKDDPNE